MKLLNNYWYVVLESIELESKKPRKVNRLGENMVFWRDSQNKVHANSDRCPHRGASLALGEIKNDCITCPFHGIQFNAKGECQHIPYLDEGKSLHVMKIKSYRVTEAYGFIWMWHGDNYQGQSPSIFPELTKDFAYYTYKKSWTTHYSRAIENQLDYFHLPFVHRKTIGRGLVPPSGSENINKNFVVSLEKNIILAEMKSSRISKSSLFKFIFPNSWLLRISSFLFLYVAFCPIDEGNTRLYLRAYIPGKGFKGIKNFVLKASPIFNKRVLAEDEAIVLTQTPKEITIDMDENLLVIDKPIALFRKQYFQDIVEAKFDQYSEV